MSIFSKAVKKVGSAAKSVGRAVDPTNKNTLVGKAVQAAVVKPTQLTALQPAKKLMDLGPVKQALSAVSKVPGASLAATTMTGGLALMNKDIKNTQARDVVLGGTVVASIYGGPAGGAAAYSIGTKLLGPANPLGGLMPTKKSGQVVEAVAETAAQTYARANPVSIPAGEGMTSLVGEEGAAIITDRLSSVTNRLAGGTQRVAAPSGGGASRGGVDRFSPAEEAQLGLDINTGETPTGGKKLSPMMLAGGFGLVLLALVFMLAPRRR